jgi:hypothetical protein
MDYICAVIRAERQNQRKNMISEVGKRPIPPPALNMPDYFDFKDIYMLERKIYDAEFALLNLAPTGCVQAVWDAIMIRWKTAETQYLKVCAKYDELRLAYEKGKHLNWAYQQAYWRPLRSNEQVL